MSRRVTLEDIAKETGVSLATVSLVLRDKPGINDATRQRVLEAARTLGYRKRAQVDITGDYGLKQIGVITKTRPDDLPQENPFYAPVLAGIESMCRKIQVNLLYASVPVDLENHLLEIPRMLLEDQLEGVLLVGAFVDQTIEQLLEQHNTPVVLVDAYASGYRYDSVVTDNFRGAYAAVMYLVQHGHCSIGLVGSFPSFYPSIDERRRGYVEALNDHDILEHYFADSHLTLEEAAESTAELLQRYPEITALFCTNDKVALGAMQAARAVGRTLPDNLSIIGFDNIDSAAHVTPALTTMHVDKASMGRLAVQLLSNRVEFLNAGCTSTILQPTLIERQSVQIIRS
ncbi:MAG: LacI family transcriptional regulator [Chloroflexi bacterium AL-W]|nr:LacI family transcriptional regulator [Chloroflexi bacterium AL-N1]NOK71305.1 LacI family transcriptional regulator [Chloroflexi bacterium AL-N10]NOK77680.1 LacI family transcriptional regulator [Chloroflexi bacterium AL-N5]NOK84531.1 LacI family transcriptional regulator [Chloroflexi bacterium AL-W]NOK92982.1 LacI family transcriptional regulator [Chloroflexi bacterium AL-N15]